MVGFLIGFGLAFVLVAGISFVLGVALGAWLTGFDS